MVLTRESPPNAEGLLYPMMVIAAVAVIVFSLVGTASVTGWMPSAMESGAGDRPLEHRRRCPRAPERIPLLAVPSAA